MTRLLTRPALLYLLGRYRENQQDFNQYLSDDIHHLWGWRYFGIVFEAPEKVLYAFKDVDESVLACPDVLRCLRIVGVNLGCVKVSKRY